MTDLIFIDFGMKINGTYYNEVLVTEQLLPFVCESSDEFCMGRKVICVPVALPLEYLGEYTS